MFLLYINTVCTYLYIFDIYFYMYLKYVYSLCVCICVWFKKTLNSSKVFVLIRKRVKISINVSLSLVRIHHCNFWGFPGGSAVKNPPANARDVGLIFGVRKIPGRGNGNPLQYSCMGNFMDRGAWQGCMELQRVGHDWARTHTHSVISKVTVTSRRGPTSEWQPEELCRSTP